MDFIPVALVSLVILAIGAIGVVIGIYLLGAFGLYTMAQKRGLDYPWISFIPIVNRYILGELTGNTMWGMEGSKWLLVVTPVVITFLIMTIILGVFALPLSIVYTVYYYMVLFRLYKTYNPERAELYIILSILFGFTVSIWLFLIRNNEPHLDELKPDILSSEEKSVSATSVVKSSVNDHDNSYRNEEDLYQIKKLDNEHSNIQDKPEKENDIDYLEIQRNIDDINQSAKEVSPEKPFEFTSQSDNNN